jgi:SAM-dependent methyltransferase
MPARRKYPQELRERKIRFVARHADAQPHSARIAQNINNAGVVSVATVLSCTENPERDSHETCANHDVRRPRGCIIARRKMTERDNLVRYTTPSVVNYYAEATQLQPAERELFNKHLQPNISILDIGVGGGRTTPYLAELSHHYVGIDYSEEMVRACRSRYPSQRFELCDASDLAIFADETFDAVIFSFNGIDYLGPEGRTRCFSEVARVLVDDGRFIFSSHNARLLAVAPALRGEGPIRGVLRLGLACLRSLQSATRAIRAGAYRSAEGYVRDPVHGGLWTYTSTPRTLEPQLSAAGLKIVDVLSGPMSALKPTWLTPWFYYACSRIPRHSRASDPMPS